ncbi:WD40 repeat domain-containing protein [Asticcacaulis sp. ZE23SCel15]|uniref:WD40 repeat domain-containing protein n=1 Tax=Asticcacaulis sp. ZE23SCel15 TaxID=3059027 RepID=UPI00265EAF18|nr:WD40 repeat domain-containing protein [Asticcacaulis sp. ZE23SCel15]WKL58143.1 WD40 repeat domain-containing protein [Asticcacaulis sp. ZE23SCel15]
MTFAVQNNYGSYVVSALFDAADEAIVALSDGRVVFVDVDMSFDAHPNFGILCAVVHPTGVGIVTGGDDGRVVWTTKDSQPIELLSIKGAWFDSVAVNAEAMLLAAASGKKVYIYDLAKKGEPKLFEHPNSVSGLVFDPKGRKLYCASYNGAYVWFSRIHPQKPQLLKWAGSHTGIAISPDGKFVVTSMQENSLHGWRLSDSKDMRMGGYPTKIKSIDFFAKGKLLATSGANGAVVWPFLKANGPMGEEASEINADESSMVTVVAGAPEDTVLAAGLDDGRVWVAELQSTGIEYIQREKGSPISALAVSGDAARILFGNEDGHVWLFKSTVD